MDNNDSVLNEYSHSPLKSLSRRAFLKLSGAALVSAVLAGCSQQDTPPTNTPGDESATIPPSPSTNPPPTDTADEVPTAEPEVSQTDTPEPAPISTPSTKEDTYLSVVRGTDPAAITETALAAIGGIERFVKPGHDVIIKPNICTDYHPPEYAVTTNPVVVGTLVKLCLGAGARHVRVMDNPFGGTAGSAYAISGIAEAVESAGGEMEVMSPVKYASFDIPEGKDIKSWNIYRDIIEADVVINVPIAKTHSMTRLTLGGKNFLGVVPNPNQIHQNIGQRIADLVSLIRPELTVIDAMRILITHGPTGGDLSDVKQTNTVIASHDIVAADAYAATLFDMQGRDISYIKASAKMGLGIIDLSSIKIEEVNL